jgi:3',5'-cyclic AMP phosphodiesterase CpdA
MNRGRARCSSSSPSPSLPDEAFGVRTIVQISDLHFGRHDADVVTALASDLNERRPDLVAVSGDFTQRGRSEEFAEARQFLNRIAAPKLVVPGNHDVPLYALHRRIFAPFARFNQTIAPAGIAGAYFRDDEVCVVGINTARRFPGKNGRVSYEQMAEIRRVFGSVPSDVFKILVTHHPIGSPEAGGVKLAGRSRMALQAIGESGGHLLLSGHFHRAASGDLAAQITANNSILLVHAGTATSNRLRGGEGNTYNLIRIDGHALSIAVMGYSPRSGFREISDKSYLLRDGRWRTD